jgi:hypothetical protein
MKILNDIAHNLYWIQFNSIPRFNSIWVELESKKILNLNTWNAIHIQLSLDSIELDLIEFNSICLFISM